MAARCPFSLGVFYKLLTKPVQNHSIYRAESFDLPGRADRYDDAALPGVALRDPDKTLSLPLRNSLRATATICARISVNTSALLRNGVPSIGFAAQLGMRARDLFVKRVISAGCPYSSIVDRAR